MFQRTLTVLLLATCLLALPAAVAAGFPCDRAKPFLEQANAFLLSSLALSPVAATQAGYHEHNGILLDGQLDDYSPESLVQRRALLATGRACFRAERPDLSAEDRADLAVLRASIDQEQFTLDELQPLAYRPDHYIETIGSALFFPLTVTRGSEEDRLSGVISRMEQVPRLLAQARANLKSADPVFLRTAVDESAGDRSVIEQIGKQIPSGSSLRARYEAAASAAQASLDSFVQWLQSDLAKRPVSRSWRTGPELYSKIFALSLGAGASRTPAEVLAAAEQDLATVRHQMYEIALPLHAQYFASHGGHSNLTVGAREDRILSEVVDRIGDEHAAPDNLLPQVEAQVDAIRDFVMQKHIVTLSRNDNLRIVPTPEFMRGVYSVAGFHSAPPLDPSAEAEYWVTPIAPGTPAEQADSRLREYNNWMLQYLTMHEALPGHYTQFEHANAIQPSARRILRSLLASGPYTEGWGEYGVKEMTDAGYAHHDPRFVLMVLKIRLRVIANAILDIRMQSMNMTDAQALDLMQQQALQTRAEALGKLRRAKLTSGQLITYYVGFHQWMDARSKVNRALGRETTDAEFSDAALDEGPLPLPLLEPLILDRLKAHGSAPAESR